MIRRRRRPRHHVALKAATAHTHDTILSVSQSVRAIAYSTIEREVRVRIRVVVLLVGGASPVLSRHAWQQQRCRGGLCLQAPGVKQAHSTHSLSVVHCEPRAAASLSLSVHSALLSRSACCRPRITFGEGARRRDVVHRVNALKGFAPLEWRWAGVILGDGVLLGAMGSVFQGVDDDPEPKWIEPQSAGVLKRIQYTHGAGVGELNLRGG